MPAGHAVDAVVDEEDGDILATIRGMNDLGGANSSEVAVALIGDDNLVRVRPLHGRGHGGCATVRGLHVAGVEIVVGEHRAADRADEDGVILDAQFLQGFANQFVSDAMSAARAIVRLVLHFRFPLVDVIEERRFFLNSHEIPTRLPPFGCG